jgi:AcrR family transcriptional regulator
MRASKAKTEIRQGQIAQTALKLLAVRGWRRVSLAAIAKTVGIVPSDVYRHFTSKDQVLDAVLDLVDQRFQTNLKVACQKTADPVACLHEALKRHVQLIHGGIPVPCIVLAEDVFTGRPRHRKRVQEIYRNYLGEIAVIIQDGQHKNLIRRELAAETLSMMLLGLVQTPAILWLVSSGGFDLRQHCEGAWQIFSGMIQTSANGIRK